MLSEGKIIKESKPRVSVENLSTVKSLWVNVGKLAINVEYGKDPTLSITFTGGKWDFKLDLTKELRPADCINR